MATKIPFCSNDCDCDDCVHDPECKCTECYDREELAWLEREEAIVTGN